MRGELDWIVMKALEKDRTRRYETANGLGMTISLQEKIGDGRLRPCRPLKRFDVYLGASPCTGSFGSWTGSRPYLGSSLW